MTSSRVESRTRTSSRFRSSPGPQARSPFASSHDDYYAQQIFSASNNFMEDRSFAGGASDLISPPPPPPSRKALPSYITVDDDENEDDPSAASQLSPFSVDTPKRRSPVYNRTPSARAKNRYRDLSRKALPTERGRLKVLRAEQVRQEEELRREQEEEQAKLQAQHEMQKEKQELQKHELQLTFGLVSQLSYWLSEQEYRHEIIKRQEAESLKQLQRTQKLALEKERRILQMAKRADQVLLNETLEDVLSWLWDEEAKTMEVARLKQARRDKQERLLQAKRQAEQALLVRETTIVVGWLFDQEHRIVKKQAQVQAQLAHELELQQAKERLELETKMADQDLLIQETCCLLVWMHHQEVKLQKQRQLRAEQERQAAAKRQQEEALFKLRKLSERSLLWEQYSFLTMYMTHQETQARERRAARQATKQAEQALVMQQSSSLMDWMIKHENATRERREAIQAARHAEQVVVVQQTGHLMHWMIKHEEVLNNHRAERQAQRELQEQEKKEEVGVDTPPSTPTKASAAGGAAAVAAGVALANDQNDSEEDENEDDVETPPATPTKADVGAAVAAGAAAATAGAVFATNHDGTAVPSTVSVTTTSTPSTVSKKLSEEQTPATQATTVSIGSDADALMIPSASSSESGGAVSNVSSLSCSTAASRRLDRVASSASSPAEVSTSTDLVVARPKIVGRRAQSTGGMMVVAGGRVRSSNRLTRSAPNQFETRKNASIRGMQSPGVLKPKLARSATHEGSSTMTLNRSGSASSSIAPPSVPAPAPSVVPEPVTVTVFKETKDTKAGISFKKNEEQKVCISKLSPEGLFAKTGLEIGYEVISINSTEAKGKTLREIALLIRQSQGDVVLVAQPPVPDDLPEVQRGSVSSKEVANVLEGSPWPSHDPGYLHASQAGVLWQTLVGQHVRFPRSWWNGARSPQMGVEEVVTSKDNQPVHLWKYLAVDRVERRELLPFVPDETSPGRILVHVVLRDETWKPVQDLAFGCYYPLDATPAEKDMRMVWMAIRKRSAHGTGSTSLIDPILSSECQIDDIASVSPLGNDRRVKNDTLRPVFGDLPPERTLFYLESELVKKVRNAMETDTVTSPEVSLMLLDLLLFQVTF